jgi:cell division septation protein DedD
VRRSTETLPTAVPEAPRASAAAARPLETPRPATDVARADDITRAGSVVPSPAARLGDHADDSANGGHNWSVQVNATKDEPTANQLVRRLQERGYNAYIVHVNLQGETWYRVRVGRFPTMEAATAVVVRLKNEERYARAFLVNE